MWKKRDSRGTHSRGQTNLVSGDHQTRHSTHLHRHRSHQALSTQLEGTWPHTASPQLLTSMAHLQGLTQQTLTHCFDFQKLTWSQQPPSILLLFSVLPTTPEYQHSWSWDTYGSDTSFSPVSLHLSPFSPVSPLSHLFHPQSFFYPKILL